MRERSVLKDEDVLEILPLAYKLTNYAYMKLLVADENVEVEKNKITRIKIEKVSLPPYTISSTLNIVRHASGIVLDVHENKVSKMREPKRLEEVSFLPLEYGKIRKGDLLGVIKIFVMGISPPELRMIENQLQKRDVYLVYRRNDEIHRDRVLVSENWYRRWHTAEWYPVIADESTEVTAGKSMIMKIKPVEIPANTIPVSLYIMRNAFGSVLDLVLEGRPKKIEESRTISKAIFIPVFDGRIERGDILGILNVYHISIGERAKTLMKYLIKSLRGNLVYWREKEVVRKEIDIKPFSFKRSSMGRLEPLISAETKSLKANRADIIRIEEMDLPAGVIVQPLNGRNHPFGFVLDVFSPDPPRKVEDEKRINRAVFLPSQDGVIEKGDQIGVVNVYHVSVFYESESFIERHKGLFPSRMRG
jgi:hypothetical protein